MTRMRQVKKAAFLGVSVVFLGGLAACKDRDGGGALIVDFDGKTVSETRKVGGFTKIDVKGAAALDVKQGDTVSLTVEGSESFLNRLSTTVENGVLVIKMKKKGVHFFGTARTPKVRIVVPKLDGLSTEGAVDAKISGLKADAFSLEVSGASNVGLDGRCNLITVVSKGAANVDARGFICAKANVTLSGASNAEVFASDEADVTLRGVGNVEVWGDPKTVNRNREGIGNIEVHRAGKSDPDRQPSVDAEKM